jgi:hypothetical protein
MLEKLFGRLQQFNANLKFIFTISPGQSIAGTEWWKTTAAKQGLIEAVHHIVDRFGIRILFPAYELVIDVLRDYRFYDIDMVHPNYAATEYCSGTIQRDLYR